MLNFGSLFAVAFWACGLIRGRRRPSHNQSVRVGLTAAVAFPVVLVIFAPTLANPFQTDAFTHLFDVRAAAITQTLAEFGRFPGQHLFFRPTGMLAYWFESRLWTNSPLPWHLTNLAIHAGNGALIYLLLIRLNLTLRSAAFGALAFLTSGIVAEPVAWIDAPFDLLATFFALLSLLLLLNWSCSGRRLTLAASAAFAITACFTKEAAFSLPLAAAMLAVAFTGTQRKRLVIGSIVIAFSVSVAFVYRWWALQGIGGYQPLSALEGSRVVELFLFRMWGLLLFPINWSTPFPVSLMGIDCVALLFLAARSRPRRDLLLAGIGWSLIGIVPAVSVASLSADLSGSRVFYFASVGTAVALAAMVEGLESWQAPIAIVLIACNTAIVEHNLESWFRVSRESRKACVTFGAQIRDTIDTVAAVDLPQKRDGVYFLSNGFPECVAFYSDIDPSRITSEGRTHWRWNNKANRFDRESN